MTRPSKLAEAVFGDKSKPVVPEWKQIQEEEAVRRQELQGKQKNARLAREATAATASKSTADGATAAKPSRRRKQD